MKKLKILFSIIILIGVMLINTLGMKPVESNQKLNLKSFFAQAMAGSEGCVINPADIKGVCEMDVDGKNWRCVDASWFEQKNCTSD